MTEEEVQYVAESVRFILERARRVKYVPAGELATPVPLAS
jgi:hypothetical protein